MTTEQRLEGRLSMESPLAVFLQSQARVETVPGGGPVRIVLRRD
jgi:hypothetical protein